MKIKIALTLAILLTTCGIVRAEEPKVISPHSQGEMKPGHTVEDHKMNQGHVMYHPQRGREKASMTLGDSSQLAQNVADLKTVEVLKDKKDQEGYFPLKEIVQNCDDMCKGMPGNCQKLTGTKYCDGLSIPMDRVWFLSCFRQGVTQQSKKYGIYHDVCSSTCTGYGTDTCKDETMRTSCKLICCATPSSIKNCLGRNGDTCAGY